MTDIKNISNNHAMPKLNIRMQTIATVVAVTSSILLPQLLHMFGKTLSLGSSLGEIILPMHLPVFLVGFLAGPFAGFITGVLAPIISFCLTAMPGIAMLPFITMELAVYGLACGLIRNAKMHDVLKVFIAQFAGRGVRAIAILISVYALGNIKVTPEVIWTSIKVGLVGITVQLIMIPLVMYIVRKAEADERGTQ